MADDLDGDLNTEEWLQKWSRHYDTLQWGVIAISTAGLGGLIAASFNTATEKHLWAEVAGLGLSMVGVFYVARFRQFRHRLHTMLKNSRVKELLENPSGDRRPSGWDVFVISFILADICFLSKLATKMQALTSTGYSCVVIIGVTVVVAAVLGGLWWAARRPGLGGSQDTASSKAQL